MTEVVPGARRFLTELWAAVARLPRPLRFGAYGAAGCGSAGAVVGLVLGLAAYPATAWFAVLEVGVPAAVLGGVVGLLTGALVAAIRTG